MTSFRECHSLRSTTNSKPSLEVTTLQVLYLQIDQQYNELTQDLKAIKQKLESVDDLPVTYLEEHSAETDSLNLFVHLIRLIRESSEILKKSQNELAKNLADLHKLIKERDKNSELEFDKYNPYQNLSTTFSVAEKIGGLEDTLDSVYDSITKLKSAGHKMDANGTKLKSAITILTDIKNMSKYC